MTNPLLKVSLFIILLMAAFVYMGYAVTSISGGAVRVAEGINPEAGEVIFWGKGKCSTCHSVGDQGSAIRCPNQGDAGPLGMPIGLRAEARAKERAAKTGAPFSAADYLIESLAHPNAYVVDGYKAEMPVVTKPPINLSPDEVKAVVVYLQSLGGEVDVDGIGASKFYKEIEAAAAGPQQEDRFELYMAGDPEVGEELFFDQESSAGCAKCHTVRGKGGKVGPELTSVAGTRSLKYIIESILEPSAVIVSGFEPFLIETHSGKLITGIKKGEDEKSVTMMSGEGKQLIVARSQIKSITQQETSAMPENFRELLTIDEFHDIVTFLQSLTGEEAKGAAADDGEEETGEPEQDDENQDAAKES